MSDPKNPQGDDAPEDDGTELSRAEEIEIERQLQLGVEIFEGGIEG